MKKLPFILIVVCMLVLPYSVNATSFDGSKPLICAMMKAMECTPEDGCEEVTVESINVSQFVKIDFKKKEITAINTDKKTPIEHMEHVDGKIIIQGAEEGIEGIRDGVGWTAAIAEDTGKMIVTASGEQVGFVIFGACTEK